MVRSQAINNRQCAKRLNAISIMEGRTIGHKLFKNPV